MIRKSMESSNNTVPEATVQDGMNPTLNPLGVDYDNHAPEANGELKVQIINANRRWGYALPKDTFTDKDIDLHGDSLTYSLRMKDGSEVPNWISINPVTGLISGVATENGTIDFVIVATDQAGATAEHSFRTVVQGGVDPDPSVPNPEPEPEPNPDPDPNPEPGLENHAPEANGELKGEIINANESWTYLLPENAFTDQDIANGDSLTYSLRMKDGSAVPSWITIDPVTGALSGIATENGATEFIIVATDQAGATAEHIFRTIVQGGVDPDPSVPNPEPEPEPEPNPDPDPNPEPGLENHAPEANGELKGEIINANESWTYLLPENAFTDQDIANGDSLTYSLRMKDGSAVPSWITIDPVTGALSGIATENGATEFIIVATDQAGATAEHIFRTIVQGGVDPDPSVPNPEPEPEPEPNPDPDPNPEPGLENHAPEANGELKGEIINANESWTYLLPENAFTDQDIANGDSLTYSLRMKDGSAVPSWITIDPVTGALSGIATENGATEFIIVATDQAGATAEHIFRTIVQGGVDPDPSVPNPEPEPEPEPNPDPDPNPEPGLENHAPEANGELKGEIINANESWTYLLPENAFTDQDIANGDSLTYSLRMKDGSAVPSWITIDPVTGALSGIATENGATEFIIVATDQAGATAEHIFRTIVQGGVDPDPSVPNPEPEPEPNPDPDPNPEPGLENHAPEANGELKGQVINANESWVYMLPENAFTDEDIANGDSLTYSLRMKDGSAVPSWINIDPLTGALYGDPTENGFTELVIVATDKEGATAEHTFPIMVQGGVDPDPSVPNPEPEPEPNPDPDPNPEPGLENHAPEANGELKGQVINANDSWTYLLPENAFTDQDIANGDSLTYSLRMKDGSAVPSWITIDPVTGALSGIATENGYSEFIIVATDQAGATAEHAFPIMVQGGVDPDPSVPNPEPEPEPNPDPDPNPEPGLENHAPEANGELKGQVINANDSWTYLLPENAFTDQDIANGDSLTYSLRMKDGSAVPSWITIDPATGALSGIATENGYSEFIIVATDQAGATAEHAFPIMVQGGVDSDPSVPNPEPEPEPNPDPDPNPEPGLENHAPEANGELKGQVINANESWVYMLPENAFTDEDIANGDSLTYSLRMKDGSAVPSWINIDPLTGALYGDPTENGLTELYIVATDKAGESAEHIFQVMVEGGSDPNPSEPNPEPGLENHAPEANGELKGQVINTNESWAYTLPKNAFTDKDIVNGDSLTYSLRMRDGSAVPSWIKIDSKTGTLSGTATKGGFNEFVIVATDKAGASAEHIFQIMVDEKGTTNPSPNPENHAPEANGDLIGDVVFANELWTYTLPNNAFTDKDIVNGDSLTYSLRMKDGSAVPSWINIDPITGTLSGIATENGLTELYIVATDKAGAKAEHSFEIMVERGVDPKPVEPSFENKAPEAHGDLGYILIEANKSWGYRLPDGAFTDEDIAHGDRLTYSVRMADGSALPSWLSIDSTTGALSGKAPQDLNDGFDLIITATDRAGATAEHRLGTIAIGEQPAPNYSNHAPEAHGSLGNYAVNPNDLWEYTLPEGAFTDKDIQRGDSLTYSLAMKDGSEVPSWISIDKTTGAISGRPQGAGMINFVVIATDQEGEFATHDLGVYVDNNPFARSMVVSEDAISSNAVQSLINAMSISTGNSSSKEDLVTDDHSLTLPLVSNNTSMF